MFLQTQRLFLRELAEQDAAALHEIERDPRVTRYTSFDPRSLEEVRAYIEKAIRDQSDAQRVFDLAVIPREDGEERDRDFSPPIGRCGLGIYRPEHCEAALWYELHPARWGKGYAVEAASALLDYAFGPLGLHRVWADCDPRNAASCRVAERLGMTLEGRLRENHLLKGEWCSTALYAILEGEWNARSERA